MFKEKIKELVEKKTSRNNKKTIENLVVFLVLLIITIISINLIWGKDTKKEKQVPSENSPRVLAENLNDGNIPEEQEYNLEKKLEDILTKISGVGKVQVLVTYSESSSVVAMRNETRSTSKTEENDSAGGTRKVELIDENKEIIVDSDNNPITEKITMPKVEVAIILAEGGDNATIKANIVQAVSAVTGLATHKIQVFKMSK